MLTFVLAREEARARKALGTRARWIYLGKDGEVLEKLEERWGRDCRLLLKERFEKVAFQCREPVLNGIAEMAKQQTDRVSWWASRVATKDPLHTDFFLLVCYAALARELSEEEWRTHLILFIEDPWLYSLLSKDPNLQKCTFFNPSPGLYREKLYFFLRGIFVRLRIAFQVVLFKVLLRRYPKKQIRSQSIGIVSYAEERAFQQKFQDPYTEDLDGFLEGEGYQVVRPVFFPMPLRWLKEVASRDELLPLIDFVKISDLSLLFKRFRPLLSPWQTILDMDVSRLLEREVWEEWGRGGFSWGILQYAAFCRFFERRVCRTLIYLFENQPWEKLLCLAAKEVGEVKLVGYQHSCVSFFLLRYFLGRGERELVPLPDKILTASRFWKRVLEGAGYPPERLEVGGALRYGYITENPLEQVTVESKPNARILFVVLPASVVHASRLVKALQRALPDISKAGFRCWIKSHPDIPTRLLEGLRGVQWTSSYREVFQQAQVLLTVSGTTSLEALLLGKALVRVKCDGFIDCDPLVGQSIRGVEEVYAEDLERVFSQLHFPRVEQSSLPPFFERVSFDVWKNIVRDVVPQN